MSEAKVAIKLSTIDAICDAVREKEQSTENIPIPSIAERISAIQTGGGNYTIAERAQGAGPTAITAADLEGITKIKSHAFYKCSNIKSVEFSNTIVEIESSIFSECPDLETVIFRAKQLDTHGADTFANCKNLKSVVIDDSVEYLPYRFCKDCSNLETVILPEKGGFLKRSSGGGGNDAFMNCVNLKNIVFPETTLFIPSGFCQGCTGLTALTIPSAVKYFGNVPFQNCTGITTVNFMPPSYTGAPNLGDGLFRGCSSLTSINLPSNLEKISSLVFRDCTSLTSMILPDGITSIGLSAFFGCSSLLNINIPNKVLTIYEYAFQGCTSLSDLIIPASVTSIKIYALQIGSVDNKATIRFLSTTPPSIQSNTIGDNVEKIIVPVGFGDVYKSATNFSAKADIIEEDTQ